jgi:hypothetical protein
LGFGEYGRVELGFDQEMEHALLDLDPESWSLLEVGQDPAEALGAEWEALDSGSG